MNIEENSLNKYRWKQTAGRGYEQTSTDTSPRLGIKANSLKEGEYYEFELEVEN